MVRVVIDVVQKDEDSVIVDIKYDSNKRECTDLEIDNAQIIAETLADIIDDANTQKDIDDILGNIGKEK